MASRRFQLKYNVQKDREIIDRLEAQVSMQDYIRKLILSDIAADILREHIQLEDEDMRMNDVRQEWYENHCPAVSDPDYNCESCYYAEHPYLGLDNFICTAEEKGFKPFWEAWNHGK